MNIAKILRAVSRKVESQPWWRLSDATQNELAQLAGLSLEAWRKKWDQKLERNRRRRK